VRRLVEEVPLKRILAIGMLTAVALLRAGAPSADVVAVRYVEGVVHGFLVLKSTDGSVLGSGDLIQVAAGSRVTTRLLFHLKDGSTNDETAVFTQRGQFRLVSDHLVQKGPLFERPLDMMIDVASGQVTVRYTNDHGEEKTEAEHMELPPDLANGLIIPLLKNVHHNSFPPNVSFVAATPKPRLVKLNIAVAGADSFSIAGSPRRATHYVLKVDIGGVAGLVAPIIGKQPPDSHIWILEGQAPAFVKSDAPLYLGGPIVRTELTSPMWPRSN
jgi:hypothetical protein